MGKRQVHVLRVRKPVSYTLLMLTTAVMAGGLYLLSGRAYATDRNPLWDVAAGFLGADRAPVSRGALLAFLMPVFANILLFLPWGFLAFVALDGPGRARRTTYLLTVAGALFVALALFAWQRFLPTRVTSMPDVLANAAGALAGAALGHARKGVRIRFDF